jgi:hypothetical protein
MAELAKDKQGPVAGLHCGIEITAFPVGQGQGRQDMTVGQRIAGRDRDGQSALERRTAASPTPSSARSEPK